MSDSSISSTIFWLFSAALAGRLHLHAGGGGAAAARRQHALALRARPRRRGSCRRGAGRPCSKGAECRPRGAGPPSGWSRPRRPPRSCRRAGTRPVCGSSSAQLGGRVHSGDLLRKIFLDAAYRVGCSLPQSADGCIAHDLREVFERGVVPTPALPSAPPPSRCQPGTACTGRSSRARRSASR